MKIYYLSTARIPEEWAHVLQIMKTCEALAGEGAEVELVVPRRHSTPPGDPFARVGVHNNFSLRYLPTIDFMRQGIPFAFHLMQFTFLWSLRKYLKSAPADSVLYIRGEIVVPLASIFGNRFKIFWEAHSTPRRLSLYRPIIGRLAGIVATTNFCREELISQAGVLPERIITVPNAVDIKVFTTAPGRDEARKTLNLPLEKKIAVYTGTDIAWKGLGVLRDATNYLPEDYLVVFVGDIAPRSDPRSYYSGHRPRSEMPLWLAAADALVLTGTARSEDSLRYTSPLKLFEYLASARPIVASDLPSFREVLDDQSAYFAAPDDPQSLASAITQAVQEPSRSHRSRMLAERYTWDARAKRILTFIHG